MTVALASTSPMTSCGIQAKGSHLGHSSQQGPMQELAELETALISDGRPAPIDRHLAQNPFICDCNLKWLADFLRTNPIETSGARCASPRRLANKRIGQIKSKKFRCSGSCPLICLCLAWTQRHILRAPARRSSGTLVSCWRPHTLDFGSALVFGRGGSSCGPAGTHSVHSQASSLMYVLLVLNLVRHPWDLWQ